MRIFTTCFFLLLLSQISIFAQRPNGSRGGRGNFPPKKVTGIIVDANSQQPLDYATVSLYSKRDSSLVAGNITDPTGVFTIETRPGRFYLVIDFLAYQTKTIDNIELGREQSTADLGTIGIAPEAAALDEVIVTAERSTMTMSLDKRVFNVGKDLGSRGGNAAELLDNVPSVQVDVEGNVSLRGSGNVRILVDGKPSGLVGVGDTDGLRNIPANLIEKVEVITNPSARYEAEGMAGIINIILKKEQKTGINGSFDFTLGTPDQYGAAINLNYRTSKLNLFTNYGINYRKGPGESSLYSEFYKADTTFITDQFTDRIRSGLSNSIRMGADYFLNDKNILTTAFTYRVSDDNNSAVTTYRDFLNNLDNPLGVVVRTDDEFEDEYTLEYSLDYKRTFEREGQELTATLRYNDNTEEEGSDLRNQNFDETLNPNTVTDLFQRSNNKESQQNLIFQTDYVQPFGEEGKFEAGLRSSFRNIDNDYLVEELTDGIWESLPGLSNVFAYDENIHAAYLIYGNKVGKLGYQVGLRGEYSDIRTELKTTNEINPRDYTNLFPSAFLSYDLPQQNSVQVSYSRRVRRPRFWDLNPFFTFSDDRNFFSGNPDLDPEFTDSYEVSHLKYFDKGSLSSAIYYRHTTDVIERITTLDGLGRTIRRPENLATQDDIGFEFNANYTPFKWWRLNGNFNFFRSETNGDNIDSNLQAETLTWFTRGTSRWTLWKDMDVQLRFNYRAPRETTQGESKSIYSFDLAASRDILNKKGTLTFSVRDIFNSRRRRYSQFSDDFFREGDFQWRARQFTLTLNYRLNQKKKRERGGRGGYEGGDGEF
ncbi:MAG: TonB-dependent receptor [Saprospiraceae bacterium]